MINNYLDDFKIYMHKKMLVIMLLGFSSGLPLLLVFSTLSLWLSESGVDLAVIGYISMVRAPYSFKFLWAPIVDKANILFLTKMLGRRRSWALFTQILLIFSLIGIAFTVPNADSIIMTVICAFLVAFCSASQDIVVDAYRIEASKTSELGATSAAYQLGYRIGMIIAGAGALYLADFFEKTAFSLTLFGQKLTEWNITYLIMAACLMIGVFTTIFLAKEPKINEETEKTAAKNSENIKKATLLIKIKRVFADAVIAPLADFIKRPYWLLIILFIMIYKLPDSYIGPMAMPFYNELVFLKPKSQLFKNLRSYFYYYRNGYRRRYRFSYRDYKIFVLLRDFNGCF
jgi:PAT family beta-lactamase induction signal transducer AmpG